MEREKKKCGLLLVETERAIYEIEFGQVQVEITGRCNMSCLHCRASQEVREDMPINQIVKILKFTRRYSPNYKEVLISGGEPFLHRKFEAVMEAVRNNGGESVFITSNGSLINEKVLDFLTNLRFKKLTVSISLDSTTEENHDRFRGYSGAFEKALKAIKLIVQRKSPELLVSVRTTLQPYQVAEMAEISDLVFKLGCDRLSFSGIYPSGASASRSDFWMTKDQKKIFLRTLYELKDVYPREFQIATSDPLKCLVRESCDVAQDGEVLFDGCPAAAVTFNVSANGDMTPCALMNLPMMNVFNLSVNKIAEKYAKSKIVKNMLDMNLKGKCGTCEKKYSCGGCRARALTIKNDYLAEDPDCWI